MYFFLTLFEVDVSVFNHNINKCKILKPQSLCNFNINLQVIKYTVHTSTILKHDRHLRVNRSVQVLTGFDKIAFQRNMPQRATGQGSHWLNESPTTVHL